MSKPPITDAEAQQLLSGATPDGHPELSALAASIADVRRDAAQVPAPQPSFALAAQLAHPTLGASAPLRRERKRASSIARFGLAAKIAAALGVFALGFVGIGAAGALPGAAQDAFDDVVSTIVSTSNDATGDGVADDEGVGDGTVGGDDSAEEPALPVGSGEFSDWVKQGARDPNKIGSEFGAAVAEQARELKNEKAEERAENAGTDGTTNGNVGSTPGGNGNGSAGSNSGGNGNGNGTGNGNTGAATQDDDESSNGNGKPADPPGGRP
jgi:hypothetical protein